MYTQFFYSFYTSIRLLIVIFIIFFVYKICLFLILCCVCFFPLKRLQANDDDFLSKPAVNKLIRYRSCITHAYIMSLFWLSGMIVHSNIRYIIFFFNTGINEFIKHYSQNLSVLILPLHVPLYVYTI